MSPTSLFRRLSTKDIPLLPLHASHNAPHPSYSSTAPHSEGFSFSMGDISRTDPLLAFARQFEHLKNHLQILLDAQSEGLIAGLGTGPSDSQTSASSDRTPTIAVSDSDLSKSKRTLPVRQPKPKRIGLRAARRGISSTLGKLSWIRASEAELLDLELSSRDVALASVDRLNDKTTGLRAEIERIESEPSNTRIKDLKENEKGLDEEIHELETRLFEMKAQQRHTLREISSLENSVQSKLSSYKSSLELVEKETRHFLARPPVNLESKRSEKKGMWALPPARRTLRLAQEHWSGEQQTLNTQLEGVVREKEALDEGAEVWHEVVREVSNLEKLLQREVPRLSESKNGEEAVSGIKRVLKGLRTTEKSVATHLKTATERDWKPLVISIGAELEALVEAQSLFLAAFESSRAEGSVNDRVHHKTDELGSSLSRESSGLGNKSEDDDNEPGPELLVEHEI